MMRRKSCSKTMAVFAILTTAVVLVPSAWAGPNYRDLYNFQGGKDGMYPSAALISNAAGNLYGVTTGGGEGENGGCGTVFELRRVKAGWTEKVLYRFSGNGKDGCNPYANLAFDTNGNLYGTTYLGGQGDCFGRTCGTVFELAPVTGGKWKETVIHRFAGGNDGELPSAGVVLDAAGNVYGTTQDGGSSCNCGTVFELTRRTGGGWNERILHSFSGTDGAEPSGLVFDSAGNLYGTAVTGGTYNEGVAFELSPASGDGWSESTIYNFEGFSDGAGPGNGLTFEGRNLYGATIIGGGWDWGTIFELMPGSNGSWAHSVLYSFTGGKDGRYPFSPFVFDGSGNLYGGTSGDVSCTKGNRWGCGNVLELMPQSDGHWKMRVLHTFTGGNHGSSPSVPLFDGHGELFGVAYTGGNCKRGGDEHCGLAFKLTP